MKKIVLFLTFGVFACLLVFAAPVMRRPIMHRPPMFKPHVHHRPAVHHQHRPAVHHHSYGPILPFAAGLAVGAIAPAVFAPRTVNVIQQPVVVSPPPPVVVAPGVTPVWVPGVWVETRNNGIVVSRQWIEGHWEYR